MLRDQVKKTTQIEEAKSKTILTIAITLSTYKELLRCENIL